MIRCLENIFFFKSIFLFDLIWNQFIHPPWFVSSIIFFQYVFHVCNMSWSVFEQWLYRFCLFFMTLIMCVLGILCVIFFYNFVLFCGLSFKFNRNVFFEERAGVYFFLKASWLFSQKIYFLFLFFFVVFLFWPFFKRFKTTCNLGTVDTRD